MNSHFRTGVTWIVAAAVIFAVALACFCVALGLDFENEGWQNNGGLDEPDARALWSQPMVIISSLGFVLSIVLFFVGVQKVSRNP